MKKYTSPSLTVKSFNKELILQDSTVVEPTITNEEAATNALNSDVTINKVAVITL